MSLTAEAQFVQLCVREPRSIAPGALEAAGRTVRDWPYLLELAVRHRVAGYVLRSGADLPADIAMQLQLDVLSARAVALLLDTELRRVGAAFATRGVPLIVLKGPALARELYPESSLRPYADLDLTIHEAHVQRAVEALASCGYRELEYDSETRRREHLGSAEVPRLESCSGY